MELGKLVVTRGVADKIDENLDFRLFVIQSLERYKVGDWGDVDDEDRQTNDDAAAGNERVVSAYKAESQPKIWIITERDRSVTTVLFPEEY